MFGVVLWSDGEDKKAVIWCEDHGDLAFYNHKDADRSVAFDAGDWVEFDMSMERNLRFAHNPRLVAEGLFPDLPETLDSVSAGTATRKAPVQSSRESAEIIPFRMLRRAPPVEAPPLVQKSAY